jgi:MFS family permease
MNPLSGCYTLFTTVMWGYDGLAGTIVLAIEQFRHDFGTEFRGHFVVSASWQLAFQAASLVGFILGGVVTGFLAKRWGRQLCMFLGYCRF